MSEKTKITKIERIRIELDNAIERIKIQVLIKINDAYLEIKKMMEDL